jgi:hypothetical protein
VAVVDLTISIHEIQSSGPFKIGFAGVAMDDILVVMLCEFPV